MRARGGARPGLREAIAVWALFALVGLAVLVTYARVPPSELYHVDDGGLAGGLGRLVVFLNFPTALAAVALAVLAADRLDDRRADVAAAAAAVLSLVVAGPGVVDQDDLDVRAVNAIPAAGVALAVALTAVAVARGGAGIRVERAGADGVRLVAASALVVAATPWWFAELGFYVSDVPGLGSIFLASEVVPEPGDPEIRAVHLGHHHGTDGVLFALAALALSRELPWMKRPRLRTALAVYLALALVYGLANAAQDFWNEQVVKRGATDASLPSFLRPELSPAWAFVVGATAAVYALAFRRGAPRARHP